jgi:hypothetical protein
MFWWTQKSHSLYVTGPLDSKVTLSLLLFYRLLNCITGNLKFINNQMFIAIFFVVNFEGFRLSTWLTSQGLSAALDPLSTFQKSEVLEDHEIENMMLSPSCSRTTDPNYSAAGANGWKSGMLFKF